MTDRLPSLVRILSSNDHMVVGAGVLVDDRHVLTCAHLVNIALGRALDEPSPPPDALMLDFLEAEEAGVVPARVVTSAGWIPKGPGERGDLAVLELSATVPSGCDPAPLARPAKLHGRRFDTFGFPRGYDDGISVSGIIGWPAGPGREWVELQATEVFGHRVQRGFSGAPVFDREERAVVGIVVASDRLADARLAWMLPIRVLAQWWATARAGCALMGPVCAGRSH